MFCFQCQEAAKGKGCDTMGVCGKDEKVAAVQDLLIFLLKGISHHTTEKRIKGEEVDAEINRFVTQTLFMTITNANFDLERLERRVREAVEVRNSLPQTHGGCEMCDSIMWSGETSEEMMDKAQSVGVLATEDEDMRSLRELLIYGLKGIAAYVEHAEQLAYSDEEIHAFIQEALYATSLDSDVDTMLSLIQRCGEMGVRAMALLDKANTESFGEPQATKVSMEVGTKPGILVSGHDLKDFEELLQQSEGKGVDIYTHCEMLPAHAYPMFQRYPHLRGNYGGAWWQQREEFESFGGVILLTTNCLIPPHKNAAYKDRIYTTGAAGCEGIPHIEATADGLPKDFSALIEKAQTLPAPTQIESGELNCGFAHNQLSQFKSQIIDAVNSGALNQVYVMAGCDGRHKSREYYSDFARSLTGDTVILTAGCAKFRYNKLPLGEIGGLPRVIDAGQCNDSYSLVVFATELAQELGVDVNDLPITYNIAWYEQKAVIVLLALLSLGVQNIHLGPTLPAFLSPTVCAVLAEKFGLKEKIELKEAALA